MIDPRGSRFGGAVVSAWGLSKRLSKELSELAGAVELSELGVMVGLLTLGSAVELSWAKRRSELPTRTTLRSPSLLRDGVTGPTQFQIFLGVHRIGKGR